jgi:hypothetical protein
MEEERQREEARFVFIVLYIEKSLKWFLQIYDFLPHPVSSFLLRAACGSVLLVVSSCCSLPVVFVVPNNKSCQK